MGLAQPVCHVDQIDQMERTLSWKDKRRHIQKSCKDIEGPQLFVVCQSIDGVYVIRVYIYTHTYIFIPNSLGGVGVGVHGEKF